MVLNKNIKMQCSGESIKKVRLTVTGHVQGVGFRYTTKLIADKLNISGSVRNELDGSVVIEVIAKPLILDEFVEIIQASPCPYSLVKRVKITPDPNIPDSNEFIILES